MNEILWSDPLSVGVTKFDEQHKQLVMMSTKPPCTESAGVESGLKVPNRA